MHQAEMTTPGVFFDRRARGTATGGGAGGGYSRVMGPDEEGTLARLKAVRKSLVDPTIAKHRGRIVKTTGDGMLVEFASAVDAVRCGPKSSRAWPGRMRIYSRMSGSS